eukprot:GHVU01056596.1.p1 GENE.GHVU01056596.1~~GHVU01056596.1.p1  ORF type:complete len:257 (-),score=27.25 GHVU01056596.1:166-936(-)
MAQDQDQHQASPMVDQPTGNWAYYMQQQWQQQQWQQQQQQQQQQQGSVGLDPPNGYAQISPEHDRVPALQSLPSQPNTGHFQPPPPFPESTKTVVAARQPVIPVPIFQEVQKKTRIVEVPQQIIVDRIVPLVHAQDVITEVPKLDLRFKEMPLKIQRTEFMEKTIEVPITVGYNYRVVHKWEIREVPRLVPRYVGEQKIIEVEVPQITVEDRVIETEVCEYVGEKFVTKEVSRPSIRRTRRAQEKTFRLSLYICCS